MWETLTMASFSGPDGQLPGRESCFKYIIGKVKTHWISTHVALRVSVVSLILCLVACLVGFATTYWATKTVLIPDLGEVDGLYVGLWRYCLCVDDDCYCEGLSGDQLSGMFLFRVERCFVIIQHYLRQNIFFKLSLKHFDTSIYSVKKIVVVFNFILTLNFPNVRFFLQTYM